MAQDEIKNGQSTDAIALAKSILRASVRNRHHEPDPEFAVGGEPVSQTQTYRVRGMTCGHCVGAVTSDFTRWAPSPTSPSILSLQKIRP